MKVAPLTGAQGAPKTIASIEIATALKDEKLFRPRKLMKSMILLKRLKSLCKRKQSISVRIKAEKLGQLGPTN